MELKYIIISFLVLSISYVAFFLYYKKYEKYVNQALFLEHHKKMLSPTRLLITASLAFTIFVVLFNIFPILHQPILEVSSLIQEDIVTTERKDFYDDYYHEYDFKKLDQGYIVAYNNDQMNCYGLPGDECSLTYVYSASMISYYNNEDELVWSVGGKLAANIDILYEHYQFQAWSVDQIDNGDFVSLGMYVDLDNNLFGIGILVINAQGEIINLVNVDITAYGIDVFGGHAYYDLISTDDGGFVIKYHTLFDGSIVVKYDSAISPLWSYYYNDRQDTPYYSGVTISSYTETLFYENNNYIFLRDNKITCLDENGNLKWEYFDNTISLSGMQIVNGDIYLYGFVREYYKDMYNLLHLIQSDIPFYAVNILRINMDNGKLEDNMAFDIKSVYYEYERYTYLPRYLFVDENGNVNLLMFGNQGMMNSNLDYILYLVQFDENGDYNGFSVFQSTLLSYNGLDNLERNYYEISFYDDGDDVVLFSPLSFAYTKVSFNQVNIDTSIPNHFHSGLYSFVSSARVILNNLLLCMYISLAFIFVVSMIRFDYNHQKHEYKEKDGNDFWDEVFHSGEKK
ncbi:MAG: hypothetical protein AB7U79_04645 [Candidatus Izemoplasmatales bacterium]